MKNLLWTCKTCNEVYIYGKRNPKLFKWCCKEQALAELEDMQNKLIQDLTDIDKESA